MAIRPVRPKAAAGYEWYERKVWFFAAALLLAGCVGPTGGLPSAFDANEASVTGSEQAVSQYAQQLGRRYDANPNDKPVALAYAHVLRQLSRYAQAVAVLQRLAATHPKDREVLGDYGKALVDAGRLQEAAVVLPQAHTPENPNWTILSAQGTVADQLGDHAKAQEYYAAALKIVPNQPDVLSNLGLSYALAKQLPMAEQTLRLAAAQPGASARVRQNLALILALEGKFDAAQAVAQRDLPPLQAAEDVASVRHMIAEADPWEEIRGLKTKKAKRLAARQGFSRQAAAKRLERRALSEQAFSMPREQPTTTASE